jgi:hypothetical protein
VSFLGSHNASMSAESVFILIPLSIAATTGVLIVTRRLLARASFQRVITRFERDLESPLSLPMPHEPSAEERANARNHASPRSSWHRQFPDQTA